jgi:hypothetical protein
MRAYQLPLIAKIRRRLTGEHSAPQPAAVCYPGVTPRQNSAPRRRLKMLAKLLILLWSGRRDSNPRPRPWQGRALPLSYTRIRQIVSV